MRRLFPGQLANEKIYIAIREHWVVLAMRIAIWAIFLALLIAFYVYAPINLPGLFEGTAANVTNLAVQVYILFLALSLFIIFVLYYLNLHIISNIRIVDIDQPGLFRHVVSELNIDKIEDVTSDTSGILGNLFDYGTVYVQTAGTRERFEFQNIPNPARIVKIILDVYEANGHEERKGSPNKSIES